MATNVIVKHFGIIKNGERHYFNKGYLNTTLKSLEGKEFEETIKIRTKNASPRSMAFYRGVIITTCMESNLFDGWTKEDIHNFFANKFLSYQDNEKHFDKNGNTIIKVVNKVKSTSQLDVKSMIDYCESIIHWLAERDIVVLSPEDYKF